MQIPAQPSVVMSDAIAATMVAARLIPIALIRLFNPLRHPAAMSREVLII
jgi:hypothetical protein